MSQQIIVQPKSSGLGPDFLALPELQGYSYHKDTYAIAGGTTLPNVLPMFKIQQGQSGSGFSRNKTAKETTLLKAGRLEFPMTCHAIAIDMIPTGVNKLDPETAEYLQAFASHSYVNFAINNNDVLGDRPLIYYQQMAWNGSLPQDGVDPVAIASGQSKHRYATLRKPVSIAADMGITFDVRPSTNASGILTVPTGADFHLAVYLIGVVESMKQN